MMRKLIAAFLLALCAAVPVHAQQATVVSSCGAQSLSPTGSQRPIYQDTTGNQCSSASLSGALSAGENVIGAVVGKAVVATCSFTRPADTTAYTSGDLVANSTTAGSVTPCSLTVSRVVNGTGMVRRIRLATSSTSLTNASFRVHLYSTCTITAANGDNGAWSTSGTANYVGASDITLDKAFTDGAAGIGVPNAGSEMNFVPTSGAQTLCALIEARGAYTPASGETFTIAVEALQN